MPHARAVASALLAALAAACAAASPGAARAAPPLHGAGATFPAPLYERWAADYARARGCTVRYDAVGSGRGIALVEQGAVDFGASDRPLPAAELARFHLAQVPMAWGAVVPVVHVDGVAPGRLRLDAATLSALFRGRIARWDDPAIAALNPGLDLPGTRVTVVHRADASGTTWLFSRWLAAADGDWRREVGDGLVLAWPTGEPAEGNEGVASLVQRTRWSIGVVEAAYARAHGLADVALPGPDGAPVRATRDGVATAARDARPAGPEAPGALEPGPAAPGAWPIVGATLLLVPDGPRGAPVRAFIDWTRRNGGAAAAALDYVPVADPGLTPSAPR